MAGGGRSGGERTPAANFPPLQRARFPRGSVHDEPSSSSASVSGNKPTFQMVTPVQLRNSIGSPLQVVTPVQQPKSQDSGSTTCAPGSVGSDSGAAPFDICMKDNKCTVKLNRSLLELNREKRRQRELSKDVAPVQRLQSGMVLLKKFLKPNDQIRIIELCRRIGLGPGGFYTPGYRDGAKLNLRMMCLGKNWDPESCSYGDIRPFDHAQPQSIPEEFRKLVKDAIQASREFLKQNARAANAPEELPAMSPDICIVNFYTSSGRLGLHQDKDETEASLRKRLPVVSFSLGDTAEFLYGDVRDDDKASKVDLESGDVLIFGGESRHIYHGVSSIKPKTAPHWLTDEASLRPGRLNLTFRQY